MDTWNVSRTSLSQHEETIIRGEDGESYDFDLDDKDQFKRSSSEYIPSDSQSVHNIDCDLNEHMSFMSKEATLNVIKQYHIKQWLQILLSWNLS